MSDKLEQSIYGTRPVLEALSATPCGINKLFIVKGKKNHNLLVIIKESKKRNIPVTEMERGVLEKKFGILYHQGVVGVAPGYQFTPLETLVKRAFQETAAPVITILDGITDPGNLGGVIRSAEALGSQGVIIPKNRAAPISPVVFKRSAGSISHFPVSRVTNLSQTIGYLKKEKFWVVGTQCEGSEAVWDFRFEGPMAIVFGAESKGMRRLVSEQCDFTVSIPMPGKTKSLNISSAASVVFYEINRQRKLRASKE